LTKIKSLVVVLPKHSKIPAEAHIWKQSISQVSWINSAMQPQEFKSNFAILV